MLINLNVNEEVRKKNIQRCREKNVLLPTFKQMMDPTTVPADIKEKLSHVGLWDVDPLNLFRITWKNEPTKQGGTFGGVNYIEVPREITGVKARILALVGKWFPTGAHKVGATYGCLAPALVSGNFDSVNQQAVWPSTGNYCRGGAYNSALLNCDSIAILPEEMSQERFNWLKEVAGEVIATPGCESNVKEIFDKCHELDAERGNHIVIFNQFDQFGNYLWHYKVTGAAILEALKQENVAPENVRGYVSATGSGGTLAAGDFLKEHFPSLKIVAAEALQCPTLLRNGFGGHRIEGIGDKHVPWVHNVKNTDMIAAIDDQDCIDLYRLFNEPAGIEYLKKIGLDSKAIDELQLYGISGIGNVLAAMKVAKYYELTEEDVIFTVLTDSSEMYTSRLKEQDEIQGKFDESAAIRALAACAHAQGIDNLKELTYYDRLAVHNLKYYTWVEQQGKTYEEINAQWYDKNYWKDIPAMADQIDELIESFNKEILAK
ncbi:pyridoxal-phosphate dependent enzyme [Sphaerochaeta halotolerans]|jgi:cysteine synthase|uniref:Pyridoxal-phosphate dependent enzyme n=1 Tax=Sphaerochaeta halotolerans TaxID=2293840 RepID=A0A372MHZ9_9SPIR|nr:pyridoxal-phosphate dependent enzyme [Sphaerochaeta halotolerans]MBG0767791.1 pyridoxal-phosphate dependent enzyme [Spirochaetaceae bacterium]MDK2859828.1 cysteine synthase [Sphaerochaeta sp.]MDN5332890.1 cysteine synthase [Sphaerochaeta sp.]MXI85640.1 pyridoxal-phosphate dependent enzyme [Sphaerochaeta halotolerans]RFU95405.1 pyridoxal-phosphate dependent enzyme [Sphaerochaeta halotolerans]